MIYNSVALNTYLFAAPPPGQSLESGVEGGWFNPLLEKYDQQFCRFCIFVRKIYTFTFYILCYL